MNAYQCNPEATITHLPQCKACTDCPTRPPAPSGPSATAAVGPTFAALWPAARWTRRDGGRRCLAEALFLMTMHCPRRRIGASRPGLVRPPRRAGMTGSSIGRGTDQGQHSGKPCPEVPLRTRGFRVILPDSQEAN